MSRDGDADIRGKTRFISFVVILAGLALTAVLYFVFHLFVLLIIFVPPLIYRILQRRRPAEGDDSQRHRLDE